MEVSDWLVSWCKITYLWHLQPGYKGDLIHVTKYRQDILVPYTFETQNF